MKLKVFRILTVTAFITAGTLVSCVADSNSPGLEYMPDMYRSPAVEAYVDYGEVEGIYDSTAQNMVEEKFSYLPPVGTVPYNGEEFMAPYAHGGPVGVDKTHGLFEVAQDAQGSENSKNDINPIPYTKEVAAEGKELFGKFCIHCHDEKGGGQGSVIKNGGGKYPTPGAYRDDLTAGEIFYTITYGKNAMGSHASQVNPKERWVLAHHVEKLIGKTKEFEAQLYFDAHTDSDGDGVMDNMDECPTVSGVAENHGCPAVSAETQVVINDAELKLVFDTGSSTISESSFLGLDGLVALMLSNENAKLAVTGHTDNAGNALANKNLSLNRARIVRDYMVEKGIAADRISAVGYGQIKPIADNSTEEGRLANRRVEFRIF